MSETIMPDVGAQPIPIRATCLDRLYTIAVKTCGGEALATETLEEIFAESLQKMYDDLLQVKRSEILPSGVDYTSLVQEVLLACQRILREELMFDESTIPEEFWDAPDVQTYLAQQMQTAEAELKSGKTVSLSTLIAERNRNESL